MITQARLHELLSYDPETGVMRWRVDRARTAKAGQIAGTRNDRGYISIAIDRKVYRAHRLAWLYIHGKWPNYEVDHIDGDRTNNRIKNLRDVKKSVNLQNQRHASANNKSGFLGVCKRGNYWRAEICVNGKTRFLGSFATPEEAHQAYVNAKRGLHDGCTL